MAVTIGDLLASRYRIDAKLGDGGFATVYRARDQLLGRDVALKVLLAEHWGDDEAKARFLREARTAARIKNDYVVDVYDVANDHDPVPFIVMELVEGTTLAQLVHRHEAHEIPDTLRLFQHVLEGLAAAHRERILHRDFKPPNVLIDTATGRPKVADFGIALHPGDTRFTGTGNAIGTTAYMSPEQLRGKGDARTDVYAAGVTLFELLCGQRPFHSQSMDDLRHQILYDLPPRPRSINPNLPSAVEDVILRALEKDPVDRYADGGEMIVALRPSIDVAAGAQPIPVRPKQAVARTPKPPAPAPYHSSEVHEPRPEPPAPAQNRAALATVVAVTLVLIALFAVVIILDPFGLGPGGDAPGQPPVADVTPEPTLDTDGDDGPVATAEPVAPVSVTGSGAYVETGDGTTAQWLVDVPDGSVAIIGGEVVDGLRGGVFQAHAGPYQRLVSVTSGFVLIALADDAQDEWCARLAQSEASGITPQHVRPLSEWGECGIVADDPPEVTEIDQVVIHAECGGIEQGYLEDAVGQTLAAPTGTFIHIQFHRFQGERTALLPAGEYEVLDGTAGYYWVLGPACTQDDAMQHVTRATDDARAAGRRLLDPYLVDWQRPIDDGFVRLIEQPGALADTAVDPVPTPMPSPSPTPTPAPPSWTGATIPGGPGFGQAAGDVTTPDPGKLCFRVWQAANGDNLAWTAVLCDWQTTAPAPGLSWPTLTVLTVSGTGGLRFDLYRDLHAVDDLQEKGLWTNDSKDPYDVAMVRPGSLGLAWFVSGHNARVCVNESCRDLSGHRETFQLDFPRNWSGFHHVEITVTGGDVRFWQGERMSNQDTWSATIALMSINERKPITDEEALSWCAGSAGCQANRFGPLEETGGFINPHGKKFRSGPPVVFHLPAGVSADVWDCHNAKHGIRGPATLSSVCEASFRRE